MNKVNSKNDKDRIRLVHFIHGMSTGGAETLVKNYMLNFDQDKFEITLLCLNHYIESPYELILTSANIKMVFVQDYLPFKNRRNVLQKIINYPFRFFWVSKLMLQENPDILHTHLQINRFLRFVKIGKDVRMFHTIHNEPEKLYPKISIRKRVDLNVTKKMVKHRGIRFIVLHRDMQEEINKLFNVSDSIVLNNGVDVERIKNAKNGKSVRSNLGIPKDAFLVGHVGRFSTQKNHDFLVDVFFEIKKRNNNAFLLMVGNGAEKKQIIKKLNTLGLEKDYLILSNRNDVPDLMNAIDVFLFPSFYEGLPLSLIEVQIAEKPCFISDKINEYVDISNLVTRLSLRQDAKEWADAIMKFKKPKKIKVNDADWDIKKITKKLEQIYLDALTEKKNGGE